MIGYDTAQYHYDNLEPEVESEPHTCKCGVKIPRDVDFCAYCYNDDDDDYEED